MNKHSKIIVSLMLALAMLMAFSACSSISSENEETTEEIVTEAAQSEDSGQNPVMNFIGKYDNGGCVITVAADGADYATFTVDWGLTDDEKETYIFSGKFDSDTLTVNYNNSTKNILTLAADGTVTEEKTAYSNGSGKIIFHEDGTLEWLDEKEGERLVDNTVFTFVKPQ
ncbi:MAG: hypothetical protein IJ851_03840 [Eubacterium sp.]|nr:hypothetical protein [Eubacterium sp.]